MIERGIASGRLHGRYEVTGELSFDGLIRTYAAFDTHLGQEVCLRQLCPRELLTHYLQRGIPVSDLPRHVARTYGRARRSFLERAEALCSLAGMGSLSLPYDGFMEDGMGFAVSRPVRGDSLEQVLSAEGTRPDAGSLLGSLRPVMRDLARLHAKALAHGNVSPQTIVFAGTQVTLAFPMLAPAAAGAPETVLRCAESPYVPLEQMSSAGPTGAGDVFSLSSVLYRCVTGAEPPCPTERLAGERLLAPSELRTQMDAGLESTILEGMSLKPGRRPKDARELYDVLYSPSFSDSGPSVSMPSGSGSGME